MEQILGLKNLKFVLKCFIAQTFNASITLRFASTMEKYGKEVKKNTNEWPSSKRRGRPNSRPLILCLRQTLEMCCSNDGSF